MLTRDGDQMRWWTWAGGRANAVLTAALGRVAAELADDTDRYDNRYMRLHADATAGALTEALRAARREFGDGLRDVRPEVSEDAIRQLKFADLLPPDLAHHTLATRLADHAAASGSARRAVVAAAR